MAQKQKDQDAIKTYKMIEGDYTIQVRVLEANDLVPTNSGISIFKSKGTAVNAFVEASVLGQVRRTKMIKGQLSPIFNQMLSFKLKDMKKSQLQNATITLTAYDRKNALLGNTIIGSYELDLSSIYFSLNHELYRTFLALSDPTDEREGSMGFILANICVLGPDDEPVIHDVTTEKSADATKGQTMMPKKINQWSHQIKINLLKGEHMVPLDITSAEIDAYIVVKYGGSKIKSKTVTSRNPEWYQQLNIGCMLPNQSKFVDISLYDHDALGDDDLAGTVQIPFKSIPEEESAPVWLNLYGAPLQGKGKEADMMNLFGMTMGSHYRGRVLMTMSRFDLRDSKTFKEDLEFKFPENPIPISEQKSYVLRIDLLEAHELPIRKQIIIQIKIGPYLLVSQPGRMEDGSVMFYENMPDKKVLFPKATEEIPDIIVYMADENIEDRRHSFVRIKAADILDQPIKPQVIKFREDRSLDLVADDEFPGFLYANLQLMSTNPGIRKPYQPNAKNKIEYELRVFLYIGRNLPPADASGTSDALVKVRCAGQLATSKVCSQTLNPGWYETLKLNVKLYPLDQEQIVPAGMFVMVFDEDKHEDNDPTYDLIGRIWITLEPSIIKFQTETDLVDILYHKPKWHNILYDATDQVQGQILLSYALIKKEDASKVPEESLYPTCEKGTINLFCIGLRNIDTMIGKIEPSNCAVSFDISGDDYDPIYTDYKKVKNKAININRLITINVDIPRNQNFCPVVDCYVWNKEPGQEQKLLGITTIQLSTILKNFYRKIKLPADAIMEEDEEDEDDQEEKELMELLDKPDKKVHNKQGLAKEEGEEEAELDLEKIDLTVPWELPIKRKVVEEKEYLQLMKQKQEEKQKLRELEDELQKNSQISQSQFQSLDMPDVPICKPTTFNQPMEILIEDDDKPIYKPTTYNPQPINDSVIIDPQQSNSQHLGEQQPMRAQRPPPDEDQFNVDEEQPLQPQQFEAPSIHQQSGQQQYEQQQQQSLGRNQSQQSIPRNIEQQQQSQQSLPKKIESQNQSLKQDLKKSQSIQEIQDEIAPQQSKQNISISQRSNQQMKQEIIPQSQKSIQQSQLQSQKSNQQMKQEIIPQSQKSIQQPNQQSQKSIQQPKQNNSQVNSIRKDNSLPYSPIDQQNSPRGSIKEDLRGMGSQRSIRELSQIDKDKVFSVDQHYKNQAELSREISRRVSIQKEKIEELNRSQRSLKSQLDKLPEQSQVKIYKSLKVATDLSFSQASKVSSKALSMNTQMKDNMDAVQKPKTGKKKKELKKSKLFSFMAMIPKKKKNIDVETYEDYDTDPGEDLDITPAWLKGRKFLKDDLEDFMKPSKKFMKFQIMSGQSRGKDEKFLQEKSEPQQVCDFKCIFLEEKKGVDINVKKEMYQKMMRPKPYSCRLYILQGVDIQSGGEDPPDLYIKIKTAAQIFDLKTLSLRRNTNNPQFYFPYEFSIEVPGACILEVEIWSVGTLEDELLGGSLIDLEDRYFTVLWHKFESKPIENRNLKDEFGSSIGRLQMWIDLVEKSQCKINPLIKITAPPRYEFELRAIIYEARNCVFKDELEKCNDLYCKAGIANQELQETDTHWRCRAKGSFNWRIKNKVKYPPLPDDFGTDKFKLQLWDKDLVGSDELIGETTFNLNTHKLIDKAVKRLQPIQITQRIREKGGIITDRFWLDVYHPDALDEEGQKISQGQALLSFELVPMVEAEKKQNGFGRDPPNVFPPLSEPTGRLSFDISNPLQFFKDIMGPDLYNKICKMLMMIFCLTGGVAIGWMFLGPLIASVLTK